MEDAKEATTISGPMLFALGFLAALSQLMYSPGIGFGRYLETMAVARSLAGTGSFADPFSSAPTGPTAHLPPLYPALLALALWIFGDGPGTTMLGRNRIHTKQFRH